MRRVGAALLLAVLGAVVWNPARHEASGGAAPLASATPSGEQPLATQGVASCASTACHHGGDAKGAARSEYTFWAANDPHAKAYLVLFDEPSRKIVKNLSGPNAQPAHENLLCLNCHVQPGLKAVPAGVSGKDRASGLVLADGVGCEICHGPAEKWLKTHYQEGWKRKQAAEKAALGLRHTKDLVVRAEVCVTCHVGSKDQEVNHTLIAAGHPRLRFEYAAYLANLPKHWDEKKDRQGRPRFDTQAWVIGQIVSMRAALKLLQHRAAAPAKPWPELAEYDCFACHHALADAPWRRDPAYLRQHAPGSIPWGSWYFPLAGVLAEHPPRAGLTLPQTEFKQLQRLMQPPYDDTNRDRVARVTREAANLLDAWLPILRQPPPDWDVEGLARALEGRARRQTGRGGWDQAAQLYLALAAQPPVERRKGLVTGLWRDLQFPPGYESPRGFDPRLVEEKLRRSRPPSGRE